MLHFVFTKQVEQIDLRAVVEPNESSKGIIATLQAIALHVLKVA